MVWGRLVVINEFKEEVTQVLREMEGDNDVMEVTRKQTHFGFIANC